VSLFADSIDFLEDATVNFLILAALRWSAKARARLGVVLAAILLIPGVATAWMAWEKFLLPVAPAPMPMTLTGLGALAINFTCAFVLAKFRDHAGSLSRAAFLSARNDALANIAIMVLAGFDRRNRHRHLERRRGPHGVCNGAGRAQVRRTLKEIAHANDS